MSRWISSKEAAKTNTLVCQVHWIPLWRWLDGELDWGMAKIMGETGVVGTSEFSEWEEKPASSAYLNNDNWF